MQYPRSETGTSRLGVAKALASVCVASLVVSIVMVVRVSPVFAQEVRGWAPRERIPGTYEKAETPFLVADEYGYVHSFIAQDSGEPGPMRFEISYSRWSINEGWSPATDIIVAPLIRGIAAVLDREGYFHVAYYCCDDVAPSIYMTEAPMAQASDALFWSQPHLVGAGATGPGSIGLTVSAQGELYLLYAGNVQQIGVYLTSSPDGGVTWTEPMSIYLLPQQGVISTIDASLDAKERLHAVWTGNTDQGTGETLTYAQADMPDGNWRITQLLNRNEDTDTLFAESTQIARVEEPAIAVVNDEVYVVYTVCEPCEKRIRLSLDSGASWQPPFEPFPKTRGSYGHTDMVVDSASQVHLLIGDRARWGSIWHGTGRDRSWPEPEPVIPRDDAATQDPERLFSPFDLRAVVSLGNILFLSWKLDPGLGSNGAWFTYRLLDSPQIAAAVPPSVTASVPIVASAESTLASTSPGAAPLTAATPVAMQIPDFDPSKPSLRSISRNPGIGVLVGVLPVLVLLAGLAIASRLHRSRLRRN